MWCPWCGRREAQLAALRFCGLGTDRLGPSHFVFRAFRKSVYPKFIETGAFHENPTNWSSDDVLMRGRVDRVRNRIPDGRIQKAGVFDQVEHFLPAR